VSAADVVDVAESAIPSIVADKVSLKFTEYCVPFGAGSPNDVPHPPVQDIPKFQLIETEFSVPRDGSKPGIEIGTEGELSSASAKPPLTVCVSAYGPAQPSKPNSTTFRKNTGDNSSLLIAFALLSRADHLAFRKVTIADAQSPLRDLINP
jgi:hypothetical protein